MEFKHLFEKKRNECLNELLSDATRNYCFCDTHGPPYVFTYKISDL